MVYGFGAALGGLVGGLILGSLGGRTMYLVVGSFVLVSVATLTMLDKADRTRKAGSLI
jgi:predicted MFS family arabinose efflux permease